MGITIEKHGDMFGNGRMYGIAFEPTAPQTASISDLKDAAINFTAIIAGRQCIPAPQAVISNSLQKSIVLTLITDQDGLIALARKADGSIAAATFAKINSTETRQQTIFHTIRIRSQANSEFFGWWAANWDEKRMRYASEFVDLTSQICEIFSFLSTKMLNFSMDNPHCSIWIRLSRKQWLELLGIYAKADEFSIKAIEEITPRLQRAAIEGCRQYRGWIENQMELTGSPIELMFELRRGDTTLYAFPYIAGFYCTR